MSIDIDNHKLLYHPERVAEWQKTGDCFPIYVEIGLTNRCNHQCQFCALDWLSHGGADIDSAVLCKNLEDMASHGVKSIMFAGEGEPFLHKEITRFTKFAKSNGLDVSITSNGVPFTPEKAIEIMPYLSWIRLSVDAGTKETYSALHTTRPQDFDTVLKNIQAAVELKRAKDYQATIGVQALLTRINIHEIPLLAEKVKALGVDNFQVKPYSYHPSSKNNLSFDLEDAKRIKEKVQSLQTSDFQVIFREKTIQRMQEGINYKQCYGLPFFALIDARGNVLPCNLFYNDSEFTYGNINNNLFSEIWKSEKRKNVLERLKLQGVEECRSGCRLDTINRYLSRLKAPEAHDNFI